MREVQTSNGRIVLHDPQWYQSGAYLPAVQQVQHDIQPQQHTSVLQAVDAAMNEAHWLFQQEYQRQLQMYQAFMGRPPCYHYEFSSVAERTKNALPQAVRAYLGG